MSSSTRLPSEPFALGDAQTSTTIDALVRHEADLHTACAWLMIATGAAVVLVELGGGIAAAYGRYAATAPFARWLGPMVPAWFAWMFQESWSVLVPLALLPFSNPACLVSPGNLALGGMFLTHYTYRSFVYPLRIRGGKPMPLGISSLAALFCFFNGYLQGRLWTALHVFSLDTAADRAFLACGGAIWLFGWCVNLHSDSILRSLRRPGETGYKIPRGGMFEYVSAANYFGEIVEWSGYAVASRFHVGCLAFALFTACNTGPRALHHHLWYLQKFEDYPRDRRALIPFVW